MTDRILKILDNVRYWETCPEDYKKDIEIFLEAKSQALRIHDVSGCGHPFDELESSRNGIFCYKCCTWVRPDAHIH